MDLTSSIITVRWGGSHSHKVHLNTIFSSLQSTSTLVDVNLICQTGEVVKCHKIVLASASPLFKKLLMESTGEHLALILCHVSYSELVSIVEYIYKGQISVGKSILPSFLVAAQHLEISGLDHLKTGDRDGGSGLDHLKTADRDGVRGLDQDQGSQPQDLSMKSRKR